MEQVGGRGESREGGAIHISHVFSLADDRRVLEGNEFYFRWLIVISQG